MSQLVTGEGSSRGESHSLSKAIAGFLSSCVLQHIRRHCCPSEKVTLVRWTNGALLEAGRVRGSPPRSEYVRGWGTAGASEGD